MVLRRIFEPKRDSVAGEWKKLHNAERSDLFSSPNIIRVIISRRMKWAGHVSRTVEKRGTYRFWWGNLRERDRLEDPRVDGRLILRWIFRKWNGGRGLD
jgi:hypothetical protein